MRTSYAVISVLSFALSGCHFFGPRDMTNLSTITDVAQLNNLSGVWKATSNTYTLTKRLQYPADSITIILHKDSTFEAINIPDCLSDGLGNPVKHQLLNATGRWGVEQDGKEWKIRMEFKPGKLFAKGLYTDFDVYRSGNDLLMGVYAGDPDEAKALDFIKPNGEVETVN